MTPADISPLPLVSVNRSCRSLKLSSRLRQRDGCCEWQFCCRTTATTHQASSNFGCFERSLLLPGIMHHLIRRRSLAALRRISPANQSPVCGDFVCCSASSGSNSRSPLLLLLFFPRAVLLLAWRWMLFFSCRKAQSYPRVHAYALIFTGGNVVIVYSSSYFWNVCSFQFQTFRKCTPMRDVPVDTWTVSQKPVYRTENGIPGRRESVPRGFCAFSYRNAELYRKVACKYR